MRQILLITLITIIGLFSCEGISKSYIGKMSSKEELHKNQEYEVDLNGDGKKEIISENHFEDEDNRLCSQLYINNKFVKEYKDCSNIKVYISDFNKLDRKKEVCVVTESELESVKTDILLNLNEEINIHTITGRVSSYDNKNGLLKIEYSDINDSYFSSFKKAFGNNDIRISHTYKRVYDGSIEDKNKKSANIVGKSSKKKFIATKDLKSYKNIDNKDDYFTVEAGSKVNLVSIYKCGKEEYIKITNADNESGWVQSENIQLFK